MRRSLLLLPLLLAGCSSLQLSTGGKTYDVGKYVSAAKDIGEAMRVTAEEEAAIGREAAANLIAKYGLLEDEGATRYVNLVGLAVARKAERKDVRFRFGILRTLDINAYAAPGGYIFVTRGLLNMLQDEAQLAGVLAHEVQHVDRKHAIKMIRRNNLVQAGLKLSDKKNFDLFSRAVIGVLERGFDKSDELDADRHGAFCLAKAGYDPAGITRALERHKANMGNERSNPFTARHPPADDRIKALGKIKGELPESGAVNKKRFLDNITI